MPIPIYEDFEQSVHKFGGAGFWMFGTVILTALFYLACFCYEKCFQKKPMNHKNIDTENIEHEGLAFENKAMIQYL